MPVRNGAASLERDIKDSIYATGFLWSGDTAVPNPETQEHASIRPIHRNQSATLEADKLQFEHTFEWVPGVGIRRIEGID